MANIAAVTDAEFEAQVLKSDKPVLVDFWAEWCGPCRQVAPILDELNAEHGEKLTFLKMNVDENPVTPSSYRVTGIPTINVYQGGEVVKSIVGAKPKAALLKELEAHLTHRAQHARVARGGPHRSDRAGRLLRGAYGPPHRSRASSTSSFQLSAVRSSIRIRGVVGCARWVLKPTPPRNSAGSTQPRRARACRRTPRWRCGRARRGRLPSPAPAAGPARLPAGPGSIQAVAATIASGEPGAVGRVAAPGSRAAGA